MGLIQNTGLDPRVLLYIFNSKCENILISKSILEGKRNVFQTWKQSFFGITMTENLPQHTSTYVLRHWWPDIVQHIWRISLIQAMVKLENIQSFWNALLVVLIGWPFLGDQKTLLLFFLGAKFDLVSWSPKPLEKAL